VSSRVATYWNTLRYLKPEQIFGRIVFQLRRPTPDLRPAPSRRSPTGPWRLPARRPASLLGPNRVRFLNETRDLTSASWNDPSLSALWRFNLHYFDDLAAIDAHDRAAWHGALLRRWVADNAPATGTGWGPYPTSLRIVNWIKWAMSGQELPPECVDSLAVQARWLEHRLERHLLGNHLFANAKALVFAGCFFAGEEAQRWLAVGRDILLAQLDEQILADGGHFERSTMYHALALEDVLDICNVARAFPPAFQVLPAGPKLLAAIEAKIPAMQRWLSAMCHPDGEIAFFNDAAFGISPPVAELDRYAQDLGFTSTPGPSGLVVLMPSGYVRIADDDCVAILDVAPVGPDYLPAHAHADTLSFELSLFGQRVIVNSGTSRYGVSPQRERERGTAAHNTVVVDEQDSSQMWRGFRVAKRARPFGVTAAPGPPLVVRGAHDGYTRLPGRPRHLREWSLQTGRLTIADRLDGGWDRAEGRFHVHPSVRARQTETGNGGTVELALPNGEKVTVSFDGGTARLETASWHPEFGRSDPNQCIVVSFERAQVHSILSW
jgi:uncharacterized heparinase superfamily protein